MRRLSNLGGTALGIIVVLVGWDVSTLVAQHSTYSGSGDDVVEIAKPNPDMPALLLIQGNASESHFAITGFTQNQERTGLLVNTTSHYSGAVPLDLPPRQTTRLLEVKATGNWTIEVYPIGAAEKIRVPGSTSGEGDWVLWLDGDPSRADISGNQGENHFAVTVFSNRGRRLGSLVNTVRAYDGTVLVPKGALLFVVKSQGSWQINVQ